MIIDFHNHFYPPEYVEAIRKGPSNIKVTHDKDNNPLLHYPGDYNILVPSHRDIDFREKAIKDAGVDRQILTFTTPGTQIETPERSTELAQRARSSRSGSSLQPCKTECGRNSRASGKNGERIEGDDT